MKVVSLCLMLSCAGVAFADQAQINKERLELLSAHQPYQVSAMSIQSPLGISALACDFGRGHKDRDLYDIYVPIGYGMSVFDQVAGSYKKCTYKNAHLGGMSITWKPLHEGTDRLGGKIEMYGWVQNEGLDMITGDSHINWNDPVGVNLRLGGCVVTEEKTGMLKKSKRVFVRCGIRGEVETGWIEFRSNKYH